MIKNIFSVFIFIFISVFFFIVITHYFSDQNKKEINKNRTNIDKKIKKNIKDLPFLTNDTKDVVEFNSNFDSHGNDNKIKRNFWNLFKKND